MAFTAQTDDDRRIGAVFRLFTELGGAGIKIALLQKTFCKEQLRFPDRMAIADVPGKPQRVFSISQRQIGFAGGNVAPRHGP